jgi:hypothetical protein
VIPTVEDIIDAYELATGDRTLRDEYTQSLLTKLIEEAWAIEHEPADEPAVLFYVLCRSWMKLGHHCTDFIDWVTVNQLKVLGLPVRLDRRELREMRLHTCAGFATLDDVREWFAEQYARQLD